MKKLLQKHSASHQAWWLLKVMGAFLLMANLAACGFELRGYSTPSQVKAQGQKSSLALDIPQGYLAEFNQPLKQALLRAGFSHQALPAQPEDSALKLTHVQWQEQVLRVNTQGHEEKRVILRVRYDLKAPQGDWQNRSYETQDLALDASQGNLQQVRQQLCQNAAEAMVQNLQWLLQPSSSATPQ